MAGYTTFSLRRDTLDRFRELTPADVSYSDFLDQLMEEHLDDTPDRGGAWRRLVKEFVEKAEKLSQA